MGEIAHRSTVRVSREKGPLRWARLPAAPEPVAFGVHSEVAAHYDVVAAGLTRHPAAGHPGGKRGE